MQTHTCTHTMQTHTCTHTHTHYKHKHTHTPTHTTPPHTHNTHTLTHPHTTHPHTPTHNTHTHAQTQHAPTHPHTHTHTHTIHANTRQCMNAVWKKILLGVKFFFHDFSAKYNQANYYNYVDLHLLPSKQISSLLPYSLELRPPSIISPPLLFAGICRGGIFISNLSPL